MENPDEEAKIDKQIQSKNRSLKDAIASIHNIKTKIDENKTDCKDIFDSMGKKKLEILTHEELQIYWFDLTGVKYPQFNSQTDFEITIDSTYNYLMELSNFIMPGLKKYTFLSVPPENYGLKCFLMNSISREQESIVFNAFPEHMLECNMVKPFVL